MADDKLKCKFCNWTTKKAYTTKDGKFKGVDKAHQRLLDHVFINHPTEWSKVQEMLAEEEEE